MNIVVYLVLWVSIGLVCGLIAHWTSGAAVWPWFWVYLSAGLLGALIFGYFLASAFFGIDVALSAYSLLFALVGALLFLAGAHIARQRME